MVNLLLSPTQDSLCNNVDAMECIQILHQRETMPPGLNRYTNPGND